MKHKVIIKECDWKDSIYNTREWEKSVEYLRYEHNIKEGIYIIEYKDLN